MEVLKGEETKKGEKSEKEIIMKNINLHMQEAKNLQAG